MSGGEGGPKLGLRALLPYVRPHRAALIVVAALSLAGTLGTLLQPLLTRSVLDGIGAGTPVGRYVAALVGLLAVVAALNASRDYLLQRTAEGPGAAARAGLGGAPAAAADRGVRRPPHRRPVVPRG